MRHNNFNWVKSMASANFNWISMVAWMSLPVLLMMMMVRISIFMLPCHFRMLSSHWVISLDAPVHYYLGETERRSEILFCVSYIFSKEPELMGKVDCKCILQNTWKFCTILQLANYMSFRKESMIAWLRCSLATLWWCWDNSKGVSFISM